MRRPRVGAALLLALALGLAGCEEGGGTATTAPGTSSVTSSVTITAPPTVTSAAIAATTTAPAPPEHHIGVRTVDGAGRFYNRLTGEEFVPRGNNYVRLGQQTTADGSSTFGHALFDPGRYDAATVAADLARMHVDGYNVVRVFLSPDTLGAESGGLSPEYMKNVVDFLGHSRDTEMYVIFTLDWLPGGRYGEILNADCCDEFALMNANFLPPAGVAANQAFFRDFASELIDRGAAVEHVMAYQVRNEMFFDSDQPPLSFSAGVFTTANGSSYDMSLAAEREAMIREGAIFFVDSVAAAIREVDPSVLVSVGLFVPHGPNSVRVGDPRLVVSGPIIWESTLDFVDLHAYTGFELDLPEHVENFGVDGMEERPIVMGEFGGEVSRFPSTSAAALAMRDWQVESCLLGFDGWIFWTWDLFEQPDFFHALMDGGAINGVLAPVIRPDPCTT